jgi:hypothetical protein
MQHKEDECVEKVYFSWNKFFLSMLYWHIVMGIGPTLQLPYDLYNKYIKAKRPNTFSNELNCTGEKCSTMPTDYNFTNSLWTIIKRSVIHLIFLLHGLICLHYLKNWVTYGKREGIWERYGDFMTYAQ